MKVIDTRGTNILIRREPGTNKWFWKFVDSDEWSKPLSFNKCLEAFRANAVRIDAPAKGGI